MRARSSQAAGATINLSRCWAIYAGPKIVLGKVKSVAEWVGIPINGAMN